MTSALTTALQRIQALESGLRTLRNDDRFYDSALFRNLEQQIDAAYREYERLKKEQDHAL